MKKLGSDTLQFLRTVLQWVIDTNAISHFFLFLWPGERFLFVLLHSPLKNIRPRFKRHINSYKLEKQNKLKPAQFSPVCFLLF